MSELQALPIIAIFTISLALLWVMLLRHSHALYLRRIGQYGKARNVVPYVSHAKAREAADDRRAKIESAIKEVDNRGVVFQEFLEIPPVLSNELDRVRQPFESDESDPFWHTALLSLQQESDQHLLVERVTDTIVCLQRSGWITPAEFPSHIRLEPIPSGMRGDQFPWRVVIATDHPVPLEKWLRYPGIQYWLGIGIDLVPASAAESRRKKQKEPPAEGRPNPRARAHGACRVGDDGMYGVVAGILQDGDAEYGVTCRHVISSECGALSWPSQPVRPQTGIYTRHSPDAAFVKLQHECKPKGFCFVNLGVRSAQISALDQAAIEMAANNGSTLKKAPDADGTRGVVIAARVSSFKLGDYTYRGAHVLIAPQFYKQYLVTWPISRRFSVDGDSGSWVMDEGTGAWLGMIVGGAEWPNTQTYAIAANYVLRAFRLFKRSKLPLRTKVFSER
jgi:hypothetical protein